MSKGVELESKFIDAIERILDTDEAVEEVKTYFTNYLVNDLIDEALRE